MTAERIIDAEGARVAEATRSTSTLSEQGPASRHFTNLRSTPQADSVDLWLSGAWSEDPGFHDGWSAVRPRRKTNLVD
ncbi:MAG: hypothetical protein AAGH15_22815 [Myxococcota bacterium]